MKLLVKVREAESSDTPQIAVLDMTPEFLTTVQKLLSNVPVNLKIDNSFSEYFFIDQKELSSLVKTAARVADSDTFTHLVLEDEFWCGSWRKIEVHSRCLVLDKSGLYFKATDSAGFEYLTAPLSQTELSSEQLQKACIGRMAATAHA